jgi:hypothetical protein
MAVEGISNSYRMVLMSVVVVMSSGTALAIKLSADENGKHHYSSAAVVLLAELFKLSISLYFAHRDGVIQFSGSNSVNLESLMAGLRGSIAYAVPGMLYMINNNVEFIIVVLLGATTVQLLQNLKIVVRGVGPQHISMASHNTRRTQNMAGRQNGRRAYQ